MKFKYYIPSQDETLEDAIELSSGWVQDFVDMAEDAAEHFYNRRDGWECAWPITFAILHIEELRYVEVERYTLPGFTGRIVKE